MGCASTAVATALLVSKNFGEKTRGACPDDPCNFRTVEEIFSKK
ncbi:hypothetical protein PPBDW_u10005 [Photobacterium kishitanii]|nr:hypothetical protein PPBDW_u10005 [Photobacterium kishitanii]